MVETSPLPEGTKRYDPSVVKNFLSTALLRVGVEPDDADLVGDVLVGADLRGVRRHGAARLSYFIVRLEKGTLNLHPNFDLKMNTKIILARLEISQINFLNNDLFLYI